MTPEIKGVLAVYVTLQKSTCFNMRVTESDPDTKARKMPIFFNYIVTNELSMRSWSWNVTDSNRPIGDLINPLILKELNFFHKNIWGQSVFSIWNHQNCLSYVFPIRLNTYVMGLRPLQICFTFTVRGSTLVVRIWRLQTSDSDD